MTENKINSQYMKCINNYMSLDMSTMSEPLYHYHILPDMTRAYNTPIDEICTRLNELLNKLFKELQYRLKGQQSITKLAVRR